MQTIRQDHMPYNSSLLGGDETGQIIRITGGKPMGVLIYEP